MEPEDCKTLEELLKAFQEFVEKRNKEFPMNERVDYAKAGKMPREERQILAKAIDAFADMLERESVFFTKMRVVTREGRVTVSGQERDTGVYLHLRKVEAALTEASDAFRKDATTLRNI
jgi:hypothetical protein